jgi:hypothetical protein
VTPKEAAAKLLEGFDRCVFVRSTARDGDPMWAVGVLPYVQALVVLKEFAESPET